VRRVDNFANILSGDEDLEVEEDVLGELSDSDEEYDLPYPTQNLIDFDSDDDVSVLRTAFPAIPPCTSLTVNLVKAVDTPPMDVVLSFGGGTPVHHQAVPDSGAGASIVSLALVEQNGWRTFPCDIPLRQADGAPLPIHGALYLDVEYRGLTISAGCFVSKALQDGLLLSWFHMRDLGLLTDRFPGLTTPAPAVSAILPEDSFSATNCALWWSAQLYEFYRALPGKGGRSERGNMVEPTWNRRFLRPLPFWANNEP